MAGNDSRSTTPPPGAHAGSSAKSTRTSGVASSISIPPTPATDSAALVVHHVFAADGEDQVAIRANRRSVLRLAPMPPDEAADALVARADATYLITGGLGDIGLHFARTMAASGARRLILLGRSATPPRHVGNHRPEHPHRAARRRRSRAGGGGTRDSSRRRRRQRRGRAADLSRPSLTLHPHGGRGLVAERRKLVGRVDQNDGIFPSPRLFAGRDRVRGRGE